MAETAATTPPLDGPVVETSTGAVRGIWRGASAAFLAIPFAAPPTDDRRFLAPQRREPWAGIRDDTEYGPTPQRRGFGDVTTIPEPSIPGDDTLSVNVFTPAPGDAQASLPVMVWIHGGGFFAGSPASPWYDGRTFNRDGVVTVSVSYRLGFDGFGWIDGAPLNRGVLDQIAALEWVRDNIREFGGDPAQVTIAGQSAGGGSVLTLFASPRAEGLFARAIAHSAPATGVDAAVAEEAGRAFAAALGIEPDLAGWRSVDEWQVIEREGEFNAAGAGVLNAGATMSEVVSMLVAPETDRTRLIFSPVVDNDVVVRFDHAIAAGRNRGVPLLLGTTANEFAFPTAGSEHKAMAALKAAGISRDARAAYARGVERVGPKHARSQLIVAAMFRVPTVRVALQRADAGASERTWLYSFEYPSEVTGASGHCIDLPFAWDLLDADGVAAVLGAAPPQNVATLMHDDWVRFVKDGVARWAPASRGAVGAMRYDTESAYDADAYCFEAAVVGLGS